MESSSPKTTPMPPIDDDTLQRFYDGDLSPLEEHSVQARIEADPDAQRRLAQLGRLTDLMRSAAEELGESVPSDALFAAIEARLDAPEQAGFGARLRVITSEWMEHKRAVVIPLVAAGAVAAASLLAVLRPGAPAANDPAVGGTMQALQDVSVRDQVGVPPPGSTVEEVDFGSSTGTVFEIENQGAAVAVVWITDDEDKP